MLVFPSREYLGFKKDKKAEKMTLISQLSEQIIKKEN